jgi:hypothetical protein
MKKKLRRKSFGKGLRADATVANIREGENSNRKTLHSIIRFYPAAGEWFN